MLQIRIDMPAVHARIPLDVVVHWCPQGNARFQVRVASKYALAMIRKSGIRPVPHLSARTLNRSALVQSLENLIGRAHTGIARADGL